MADDLRHYDYFPDSSKGPRVHARNFDYIPAKPSKPAESLEKPVEHKQKEKEELPEKRSPGRPKKQD